jgi:hypothetical protein
VRADEREHVVDRRDTVASDLLIEELGFCFVDGRCRQRNENAAVIEGREFDSEELNVSDDGGTATRERSRSARRPKSWQPSPPTKTRSPPA